MSATVLLEDVVEALEMQLDESNSYVDMDNGQVETVSRDLLRAAEEAESEDEERDLPGWQREEWELAKRIVFHYDKFQRLPSKYDVHEWDIMRRFPDSVQNRRIADELQDAIHGAGAFRMFKSVLRRHKMEQQWHSFRQEVLEEIARDWCEQHGIPWK
jgi:hypothetical protein